jgi:fatty acid desaturase
MALYPPLPREKKGEDKEVASSFFSLVGIIMIFVGAWLAFGLGVAFFALGILFALMIVVGLIAEAIRSRPAR